MNLGETAALIIALQLKDGVSAGLAGIKTKLDGLNKSSGTVTGGLTKIGQGLRTGIANGAKIATVGIGAIASQVALGLRSLAELEDVMNQTDAVIKSTGGSAGVTAEEVRALAQEMEDLSGVDDKVIQSGENVLLTFTNIREDAFEPALQAALDLSAAMDQDLSASALQVGKALNDPIGGLTALRRVGVQFTQDQEDVIKALVETGDVAGAQQVIIAELNKEFGGSAAAQMEGYRGTLLRLQDTWEDLQMTLATAVAPALDKIGRKLNEFLSDPETIEGVRKLGDSIAELFSDENIEGGGQAMRELFTFLKELPWSQIKDGLSFAAESAKKVVDVFRSLPPGVQAGLLTFLAANKLTGGLVTSGLGELVKVALSSLRTITAANVTVIGANVTAPGAGVPGAPVVASRGIPTLVKTVGSVALAVVGIDQLIQITEAQKQSTQEGIDSVESAVDAFLAGDPTLEQIDQKIAELRSMPGSLGVIERGIYELNLGVGADKGVKTVTEEAVSELVAARTELKLIRSGIPITGGTVTAQTPEQVAELQRINNAVSVLPFAAGQTAEQTAELERIGNYTNAVLDAQRENTQATREQLAMLGEKLDVNKNTVTSMKEVLADKLGVSVEQLRGILHNEQTVADRLGISIEELRDLQGEARNIAAEVNNSGGEITKEVAEWGRAQLKQLDANRDGILNMKEVLAAKLGVSIESLRGIENKEEQVAARLGITVEQLRLIKGEAAETAGNINELNRNIQNGVRITNFPRFIVNPRDVPRGGGTHGGDRGELRQHGGRANPFRLYRINEAGEEGFIPDVPGFVVNHAMMQRVQSSLAKLASTRSTLTVPQRDFGGGVWRPNQPVPVKVTNPSRVVLSAREVAKELTRFRDVAFARSG